MRSNSPSDDATRASLGFFADLPRLQTTGDTFDVWRYRPAPGDWMLVVTDIVDSTTAIANGQYKTVNFVAAMAIAALKNLCAPTPLPFLFGGDGSVVLFPPQHADPARRALARVRGFAAREHGLALRAGVATVATLRRFGSDVLVGRFEPSPGNSFGVFLGGGVAMLEAAVRGRGDPALAALVAIPAELDDGLPVDLAGLSCRWNPLRSGRGKMVALIIHGAADPGAEHAAVMRIAGADGHGDAVQPVRAATLGIGWPPRGLLLEARASRQGRPLWLAVLRVLAETLLARAIFAIGRPVGGFDPQRYINETATNTDFSKHDETVGFVIDCPVDCVAKIKAYLDGRMEAGALRYGMNVSDTALMTCLVTSPTASLHVHFVDGGDGGYTAAARTMKALARAGAAGVRA
ncbi:MAG: DUF3095 domain-containing protein [Burkholderiales bacterium]|nr:DUF3095 domain-containing protein [Burkholderiales bacterium]